MTKETEIQKASIRVDLGKMLEVMNVGVRRASAFLKFGLMAEELPLPVDMSLSAGLTYEFWPNPVGEDDVKAAKAEYRNWLIASCLKELDQYCSLYLDEVWRVLDLSDLHGERLPKGTVLPVDLDFSNVTNVAKKLERISERIGAQVRLMDFISLSRCRNSLTHAAGSVREREKNHEDGLQVSWLGVEISFRTPEGDKILGTEPVEAQTLIFPKGAEVIAKVVERKTLFKVGEKIKFSEHDLSEICSYYSQVSGKICDGVLQHLTGKGIPGPKADSKTG